MKKALPAWFVFFFFCAPVAAQPLVLQGRIWCLNHQNSNSTSGAENIIVIPGFLPQKSTLTGSNPKGYYEINTGIDLKKLEGKTIRLYAVSNCKECTKMTNAVFVSADQANKKGNPPGHLPIDAWKLKGVCQSVELDAARADGTLQTLLKQPAENLDQLTAASALVAPTSLLSLIAKLAVVAPAVGGGNFKAEQFLDTGKMHFGKFLYSSALYHTSNQGFNFSPFRNLSEAVFYNPSALVNSPASGNISGFTNLKNIGKLSGYFALTDKLTLAAGGIYTRQDEFRRVRFISPGDPFTAESFSLQLTEYAAFLSPVYKVSQRIGLAVTAKFIGQEFNAPDSLVLEPQPSGNSSSTFFDQRAKKYGFDADLSFTYNALPSFQIGLNVMNIAGTQLYSQAFVAGEQSRTYTNQRALGAGFCYKHKRLNVGADLLFTEDEFFDAAIGINYIPFNNILLSGGVAVKQGSYSLGVRLKHFRVGYIYDNDWLVNEKRPGRSVFTKGRVYSGFTFDF